MNQAQSPRSVDDEEDGLPTPDGVDGTEVSNSDVGTARRRRQQVKQACQHCRRRKIKCDEVRPVCKPCHKAKLACLYELPAGTTRLQAMTDNQQKLRDELHLHTSLIHVLRSVDQETSFLILQQLRRGAYDSILLGRDTAQRSAEGERMYPWDTTIEEARDRPGWYGGGMAGPFGGPVPAAAWAIDGTARSPSGFGTPSVGYADGAGRHPDPYAPRVPEMATPDGMYPSAEQATQHHLPPAFYQQQEAQYGSPRPQADVTQDVKPEQMSRYGQPTAPCTPQFYASGDASEPRPPPTEDHYQQGRR